MSDRERFKLYCPDCRKEISSEDKYCKYCGKDLNYEQMSLLPKKNEASNTNKKNIETDKNSTRTFTWPRLIFLIIFAYINANVSSFFAYGKPYAGFFDYFLGFWVAGMFLMFGILIGHALSKRQKKQVQEMYTERMGIIGLGLKDKIENLDFEIESEKVFRETMNSIGGIILPIVRILGKMDEL